MSMMFLGVLIKDIYIILYKERHRMKKQLVKSLVAAASVAALSLGMIPGGYGRTPWNCNRE